MRYRASEALDVGIEKNHEKYRGLDREGHANVYPLLMISG